MMILDPAAVQAQGRWTTLGLLIGVFATMTTTTVLNLRANKLLLAPTIFQIIALALTCTGLPVALLGIVMLAYRRGDDVDALDRAVEQAIDDGFGVAEFVHSPAGSPARITDRFDVSKAPVPLPRSGNVPEKALPVFGTRHRGSVSMNTSEIKPSILRLLLRNKAPLMIAVVTLFLCVTGFVFAWQSDAQRSFFVAGTAFGSSVLLGLFSLGCALFGLAGTYLAWLAVGNGLLTPGIVSRDGKRLYCLANLSHTEDFVTYGVNALNYQPRDEETEVVCSSVFNDGDQPSDHYHSFSPTPLWWGSSQQELIENCRQRIPAEMWNGLRQIAKMEISLDDFQMLLVDENFKVTSKVSTRPSDMGDQSKPVLIPVDQPTGPKSSFMSGYGVVVVLAAALLLIAGGITGGVYSTLRGIAKEDAEKLALTLNDNVIVKRELGKIDAIDKNYWGSTKRKEIFNVTGPLGEGKVVKVTRLFVTTSLQLKTANGEWGPTKIASFVKPFANAVCDTDQSSSAGEKEYGLQPQQSADQSGHKLSLLSQRDSGNSLFDRCHLRIVLRLSRHSLDDVEEHRRQKNPE